MDLIHYLGNKQFSVTKTEKTTFGKYAKLAALSVGVATAAGIVKIVAKKYGNKVKDELLDKRNTRLNQLADNYAKEGISSDVNPTIAKKYYNELTQLTAETLAIESRDSAYKIKSTSSKHKSPTILNLVISPYLALLQILVVRGIHIIAGTELGADRRDFEIVYDPDHMNTEDVIRDPFRTVIFKYRWPSHGFNVKSGLADDDANKLLDATNKFLSSNPRFLAIRVK